MEKKKKIFYLDFIRVISMFLIVTYHFYAHFAGNNITGIKIFSNDRWGIIGVALFFMISGASLMYNYGDKINLKQYAKKRFLGIYPMFWIAYILVYTYIFYGSKSALGGDLPSYRYIISLFAMDGYLSPYVHTFYLIGEWFLGCIVLIYFLFPLLRLAINKYPKTLLIVSAILNYAVLIFYKTPKMPLNENLIVCTFSFILGMYVIKYIKKIKIWHALIALIAAIALYCIPRNLNVNLIVLTAYLIGYCLFFALAYIGEKIQNIIVQKIFSLIGKYSYAVFLVHHFIIMKMESTFANRNLRIVETISLYIACWVVISICSKVLFMINKGILSIFKNDSNRSGEKN